MEQYIFYLKVTRMNVLVLHKYTNSPNHRRRTIVYVYFIAVVEAPGFQIWRDNRPRCPSPVPGPMTTLAFNPDCSALGARMRNSQNSQKSRN